MPRCHDPHPTPTPAHTHTPTNPHPQDWLFIVYKRVSQVEYAILLATFGLVLVLGLEGGIVAGVVLSTLHFAYRWGGWAGGRAGVCGRVAFRAREHSGAGARGGGPGRLVAPKPLRAPTHTPAPTHPPPALHSQLQPSVCHRL